MKNSRLILLVTIGITLLFGASCTHSQERPTEQGDFDELVETYEPKDRDIWQKPEVIFQLLGDMSRKTIADVGAGTGYFSIRLAPKAHKVLALEIDPRFVSYIDSVKVQTLPKENAAKLTTRLVEKNNPKLAAGEVDDVLIVNTFGYIKDKVSYLEKLKKGMKKGGRIIIVDYRKENSSRKGFANYLVTFEEVETMLKEAGYTRLLTDNYSLDYQYIIMAQKED